MGFPKTESGAEIGILKRFYTPEQAKDCIENDLHSGISVKNSQKINNR